MSLAAIKAKIEEKLEDTQTINTVSGYRTHQINDYPIAEVTLRQGEIEFASTAHNKQTQGFTISVSQEFGANFDKAKAERVIVEVLDEIQTAFNMDTTLSGTVKWQRIISWRAGYEEREHDLRILDIDLDAFELVSAT